MLRWKKDFESFLRVWLTARRRQHGLLSTPAPGLARHLPPSRRAESTIKRTSVAHYVCRPEPMDRSRQERSPPLPAYVRKEISGRPISSRAAYQCLDHFSLSTVFSERSFAFRVRWLHCDSPCL
jgi:hypothetical protein